MPSMRRAASMGATLVAVVLFAACGEADREAFPLATREPASNPGGNDAIVLGVLEVDLDRGCVWLGLEGLRYPVVWPTGATAEREPFVVHLPGDVEARPGDHVSGAGGYLPTPPDRPDPCSETGEVALFNHDSRIEVEPAE
ncbi:MAG: hypothetical protein R3C39_00360 [Dehalococcoidia bacterium]